MQFWRLPGFIALLFVCSCPVFSRLDPITIRGGGEFRREYEYLTALLDRDFLKNLGFHLSPEGAGEGARRPAAFALIDFYSSWDFEQAFGTIPLSKTWYVPREDPLSGRFNTDLMACLGGREDLIPLTDLDPPFVALKTGAMTVEDEGYPLVKVVGISFRVERLSPDSAPGEGGGKKAGEKKIERAGARLRAKIRALEEALRAADNPLLEPPPGILWIAAGGDLMLGRGAAEILAEEGPRGIFGETAEFLSGSDLALVNLEGVISGGGTRAKKSFHFRFNPPAAALRAAGIDGVLQANNHVFDYGMEAFRDSLNHLETAGIAALGAGLNDDEASRPFVFQKGAAQARIFGIASFPRERNGWDGLSAAAGPETPGLLHARRGGGEKLKQQFTLDGNAPALEPLDIVLFHGGVEWDLRPDADTRDFYTDLIRGGADLIIGSHPHVVQGFEWVLEKPVFWSLGNYVFGGMENTGGGEQGLFIHLGFFSRRLVYLEPYALVLSHSRTAIGPAEGLNRFYVRSRELRNNAGDSRIR
jgi:poly-gamma-glutamate synthesis protein (capsule biosynthesis protein)